MKKTLREKWSRLKNTVICTIYPIFGYPTIQGVNIEGTFNVLSSSKRGLIIKNSTIRISGTIPSNFRTYKSEVFPLIKERKVMTTQDLHKK